MAALPKREAIEQAQAHTKIYTGYAAICQDNQKPKDFYWFYGGNPSPQQYTTVAAVKNGELLIFE
jgi:hypothetical protein